MPTNNISNRVVSFNLILCTVLCRYFRRSELNRNSFRTNTIYYKGCVQYIYIYIYKYNNIVIGFPSKVNKHHEMNYFVKSIRIFQINGLKRLLYDNNLYERRNNLSGVNIFKDDYIRKPMTVCTGGFSPSFLLFNNAFILNLIFGIIKYI